MGGGVVRGRGDLGGLNHPRRHSCISKAGCHEGSWAEKSRSGHYYSEHLLRRPLPAKRHNKKLVFLGTYIYRPYPWRPEFSPRLLTPIRNSRDAVGLAADLKKSADCTMRAVFVPLIGDL